MICVWLIPVGRIDRRDFQCLQYSLDDYGVRMLSRASEREVLDLVVTDKSNKVIAYEFGFGQWTV